MEDSKKHIDDLFKQELGNYAETPPPLSWEAMEKRLDVKQQPSVFYRWSGYFAMASLLLILGVSVTKKITGVPGTTLQNKVADNTAGNKNDNKDNNSNNNSTSPATAENSGNADTQQNVANAKNNADGNNGSVPQHQNAITGLIAGNYSTGSTHNKNRNSATGKKQTDINETSDAEWNGTMAAGNQNDQEDVKSPQQAIPVLAATAKQTQDITETAKKDPANKKIASNIKNTPPAEKPKREFSLIEAGIKAGVETGFNNDAARKIAVAPYVQLNLTSKFSVMLQPSVKSSYINSRRIGSPQSYYKVNEDGNSTQVGPSTPIHVLGGPTLYLTNYEYKETHDSIVKTYGIGHSYMEFELPVLIKYNLGQNFSVYGGVNIAYSKLASIAENTYNSPPINKAKDTFMISASPAQATPPPTTIKYQGAPISSYSGPLYAANQGSELRFGYMLGFSYEYSRRWLVDALVQQAFAKPKELGGYDINSTMSSAYIRVMVGYKLTK